MAGRYGAAHAFPKEADNVDEWLEAIGLGGCKPAFEGLSMADLKKMSDTERRERVPIDGQRKRLVLALQALVSTPEPATPTVKFNSTSSLFIDSTISKPCIEEMIFCVSIVIHDRINEGEEMHAEATRRGETLPAFEVESKALLQVMAESSLDRPSEDAIFHTIKSIYGVAEFSPECLVISLLFIERLRTLTGVPLLVSNWQPILLASMVVAQKVWDDQSLLNVDFSVICNAYTVQDINKLEKKFLELIEYNVSITASLYASYYFELRTLCEKAERDFLFKPLSEEQQRNLESRTSAMGKDLQKEKRWNSANLGQLPSASPRLEPRQSPGTPSR